MTLYRSDLKNLNEDKLTEIYNKYVDMYNAKLDGKKINVDFFDLKQTMAIIKAERHKQMQRRYNFTHYYNKKSAQILRMVVPGMHVSFREDGERRFGVVQKVCAKTVIVNEDNVQWQIDAGAIKPLRRIKKNKMPG
jgi:hypothetical protein